MSYIDTLSDDLFEKILDIRCDDIEKVIKSLNKKLIKLKKKLRPFSMEYVGTQYIDYDDYEYNQCWCIHYGDVSYCMSDYLYSNFDDENYIVLVSKHFEYFSEEGGGDYISKKMFKPTFFDILVKASKSVLRTKDYHHRFLEGLHRISNYDIYNYVGIRPNKNTRYYEFMLGS